MERIKPREFTYQVVRRRMQSVRKNDSHFDRLKVADRRLFLPFSNVHSYPG
jgi:hypothetical protein